MGRGVGCVRNRLAAEKLAREAHDSNAYPRKQGRSTENRERKTRSETISRAPKEKAAVTKSRYDYDVKDKPYLADFLRQTSKSMSVQDLFKLGRRQSRLRFAHLIAG
jgi:hypothetical protein